MGIDPVSDYRLRGMRLERGESEAAPFPLFMSGRLASRLGLEPGDFVSLARGARARDFHLAGTLAIDQRAELPENILVTDIAAAQVFLGKIGRLSHIDLRLGNLEDVEELRSALPQGAYVIDTGTRNRARLDMTRAFRINLAALGLLALVIGLFLIYNTISFQVIRRRPLFALLRAMGATADGVVGYLLAEAAVIAAAGVVSGIVLGVFLSQFLHGMVTGTINALYFDLSSAAVRLQPATLFKSAAISFGATMLATAIPALQARRTPPRGLFARSGVEAAMPSQRRWLAIACLALLFACVLLLAGESLVVAFAGLFLLILGGAAFAPPIVAGISRLLSLSVFRFASLSLVMAARNVRAHLSRTGIATAALSVAVSTTLGVGLMISSFRVSVEDWLASYLRADIYISMAEDIGAPFSEDFINGLRNIEGITAVSLGRRLSVDDPVHGSIEVFALDTTQQGFSGFQVKSGSTDGLWERFRDGNGVLVSEPFANRFGLEPGDAFSVVTDRGRRNFDVAAVYYDYSSDRGVMAMSASMFERYFDARGYRAASLYLADNDETAVARALAQFERTLNTGGLFYARSNKALREASLGIFDQTFRVTGILRLLAIVVAVTGIVSALMALQLERAREYATLRAIGFTRGQLVLQTFSETGLTGLAAGALAAPIGVALSVVLISVINLRSFGWSMQVIIDPALILQSWVLAVVAALAAGIYPALRLCAFEIGGNLRND
jgi:putative ABC transport system permease protein